MWLNCVKYLPVSRQPPAILAALLALSLVGLAGASGAEDRPAKQPSAQSAKPAPGVEPLAGAEPAPGTRAAPRAHSYMADLKGKAQRQGSVAAAGVQWTCSGRRCTAQAPWPTPQVDTCRELAKLVGKVRVYGHDTRKLSRSQLRQCNAGVGEVAKRKVSAEHTAVRPETSVRGEAPAPQSAQAPRREVRGERRAWPLWRVSQENIIAAASLGSRPEVTSQGDDCDDSDPNIHPNQPESRCDGVDDNCNGEIDEGLRITAYRDRDHDLFGDPESGFLACPRDVVGELTDNNFDCDDNDPTVNPPAGNCP
jgi:hypothetical protein